MRILGIDPGLRTTGFGVVDLEGQKFRYIALPLLAPFIFFATLMTLIGNMQLFNEPMILTQGTGGVDNSGGSPRGSGSRLTPQEVKATQLSVTAFLIVHPRGTLLWDTGYIPDSAFPANGGPAKNGVFAATRS